MDCRCKVKEAPLLIAVEVSADVRAVLAIVRVLGGDLDDVDMGALRCIGRPLDGGSRPTDARGNTVKKFKFGDEEIIDWVVSFPDPRPSQKNGLFVLMEESQCVGYFCDGLTVDGPGLSKVTEIRESSDAEGEILWNGVSDDRNDIALDVAVIPAGDLFERRDTEFEMSKANTRL